jgi:hypothetical protein
MAMRLGNASEACDAIGVDMAELWEAVARGELRAEREDPNSGLWTIFDSSPEPDPVTGSTCTGYQDAPRENVR